MTEQVLKLEKASGFLRKISINVLNKNADFTLFTLPIEGIPLTHEQLDAFMGQYTHRSWYDQRPDGAWHPCTWWSTRKAGWELDEKYAASKVTLAIDGKDWTFEEYRADEEDDSEDEADGVRPGGRISSVVLAPTAGGTTLLSLHLQVRPRLGAESTALLAHQFRNVIVSFDDTTVAGKHAKQQSLPLPAPSATPGEGHAAAAAAALGKQLNPDSYADGTTKVPDETGHQSPPPVVSRGGEAIDAEMRARHPEASEENMGTDPHPEATNVLPADGGMDPDLEADVKKFEDGARANLDKFTANATTGGAIDGTTTRSRRRRRGGDDATH